MSETRPLWNYGKNASFGLRFSMLSGDRVLVLVHKGVIFKRARTVVYKMTVPAAPSSDAAPSEEPLPVTVEMKIRIKPELAVVPSCGAILSASDFPICLFASDGDVVYTDDSLGDFRKFAQIPDTAFYEISDADSPESFDFPELDGETYVTGEDASEGEEDDTKRGLLTPLWRVALRKDGAGYSIVDEVLDIRDSDTMTFEEKGEDDSGAAEEPGDEECEPHGEAGDDGDGGEFPGEGGEGGEGGGGGGGGGEEEGVNDPASEEETKKPC